MKLVKAERNAGIKEAMVAEVGGVVDLEPPERKIMIFPGGHDLFRFRAFIGVS